MMFEVVDVHQIGRFDVIQINWRRLVQSKQRGELCRGWRRPLTRATPLKFLKVERAHPSLFPLPHLATPTSLPTLALLLLENNFSYSTTVVASSFTSG